MLIDTHAHLNFPELADTKAVLNRAHLAGVEIIINIGTNLEDSEKGIEIASKFPNVYTTVGIHPNDDNKVTVESVDWEKFEQLAKQPKVVAVGECGLDYSRLPSADYRLQQDEKERQKKLFLKQIELSLELKLPLSVHVRDAYDDMVEVARTLKTPAVFHCMSGTPEYLNSLLSLGDNFYFSFAGNVTFNNADNIRELAKLVPLDKLLVETDCPFLAPEPHRGQTNEPANVRIVAERLAEIKDICLEELAQITSRNTAKIFNLNSI